MKWITVFTFLLAAATLVLAACGGQPPEPIRYEIEMSEYAFSPDTLEVRVGQEVTLELVNVGNLEHEIMFGRQVATENNRPSGYQEDMFVAGGVEPVLTGGELEAHGHAGGFAFLLPSPGDRATLTFTATRGMVGEWEMGCFEQEGVHYDAGMHGTFIVNP